MHPAQLRVLPYARSAPDRNKARSHAPVKEHCTRSERVQCLLMGCTAPSVTSKNTELPEWRTPKDPQGLALVPGGGGRAWPGLETTRRAKLAARTASGRAAAPRHQHADKQENTSSADGKQAARGADAEWAGRVGGPSGRAAATRHQHADKQENTSSADGKQAARGADAEWAGRVGGPSGRAAATRHQHAEHAHTTRPGPAAPNSAEDPGLVKQSDQTVHHEGGECFERGLDLALGQRCERCDSVVGPGAREFARLIEHVVGAQAFHDRGEGLVGG